MDDNLMQTAIQPFVKLVQSNMALISEFSTSPDVASKTGVNMQNMFQQNQDTAAKLFQSPAFTQLAQGMLKNYTEFMTELGQTGMAVATQAQSAMVKQTQTVSDTVTQATKRAR
jgi:hypothetical protein